MARLRLRSPVTVAIALALAGVVGIIIVLVVGDGIREEDRRAYDEWERVASPLVADARAAWGSLVGQATELRGPEPDLDDVRASLTEARTTLERARRGMQGVRLEPILHPMAAGYLEGVARSLQAVGALQDVVNHPDDDPVQALTRYDEAIGLADRRFADGDDARARLRQRLRIDIA